MSALEPDSSSFDEEYGGGVMQANDVHDGSEGDGVNVLVFDSTKVFHKGLEGSNDKKVRTSSGEVRCMKYRHRLGAGAVGAESHLDLDIKALPPAEYVYMYALRQVRNLQI